MMRQFRGLSLIELLIVIAVIGIISAVAVPAYRSYIETAQMSKVNSAYEYAVRVAREEFAKDTTRVTLGLNSTLPTNTDGWMELFDPGQASLAPGGGPAFINRPSRRQDLIDTETTGAVHVRYNARRNRLDIGRPAYAQLKPFRARITRDNIETREFNVPNS